MTSADIEKCRKVLAAAGLDKKVSEAVKELLSYAELGVGTEMGLEAAFAEMKATASDRSGWDESRRAGFLDGGTWLKARAGDLRGRYLPKILGQLD